MIFFNLFFNIFERERENQPSNRGQEEAAADIGEICRNWRKKGRELKARGSHECKYGRSA